MLLKLIAISDTHNAHQKIRIPPCDILIHAGDESFRGEEREIRNFAKWFDKQPAKHLIWIPGNHSRGFEANYPTSLDWIKEESLRTNVLLDSGITIEGINIWGSPQTPYFHNWAYNVDRGENIRKYWDMIPNDTSIVITHGPPFGILDIIAPGLHKEEHVGCEELMKKILEMKPKFHIMGHIHEGYGIYKTPDTTFINASIMDEHYNPINLPQEFDYEIP